MADKQEMTEEAYASTVFEDGGTLVVDLTNVEEMKYEAIPKGIYAAIIDEVEYTLSKNSGHPMFKVVFAISEGDFAGRKLFYYISFSPKALAGSKTALLRIDPTIFNGPFKPQEIADSGQLLNKPVRLKVSHEDYNGEARAKVQFIMQAGEGGGSAAGKGFF